jgi:hypothetical protein
MTGMKEFSKILYLFLVLLSGCTSGEVNPGAYLRYVDDKDNGYFSERNNGSVIYTLKYLPPAYNVIRDKMRNGEDIQGSETEKEISDIESVYTFLIEIKEENGEDILKFGVSSTDEYRERLAFLDVCSAGLFSLVIGKNIITCNHAQFEQTYGATPYCRINLFFTSDKSCDKCQTSGALLEDMVVEFNDIIWGGGKMKFRFEKGKLNNTPRIKYYNYVEKNP